jgi:hypothetical protein
VSNQARFVAGKEQRTLITDRHFFAFLFWQRAYHMPSPLQGTRTNFLHALLKIGSGTHLAMGMAYDRASLANKKAKK